MTTARRIVTVLGARPQFIKASAVSAAVAATPGLSETIVHTGQHFDDRMSTVFFEQFGLYRVVVDGDEEVGAGGSPRPLPTIPAAMIAPGAVGAGQERRGASPRDRRRQRERTIRFPQRTRQGIREERHPS